MPNYKTADIRDTQLPRIASLPINRQNDIVEKFKEPLNLLNTLALIKEASEQYQKDHELAHKADAKLHELLKVKGFYGSDTTEPQPTPSVPTQTDPEAAAAKAKKIKLAKAKAAAQAQRLRLLSL